MTTSLQSKVHVVEDDEAVRTALSSAVARLGFPVMAHASAEAFLSDYEPAESTCLVLDINLPGMHGIDLLRQLRRDGVSLPTLVLSQDAAVERVVAAVQRGAVEFLAKPPSPEKFLEAVRKLVELADVSAAARRNAKFYRAACQRLSPREQEVMQRMLAGASPKQVASSLGISLRTAHIHRSRILQKFAVASEVQLLRLQETSSVAGEPCS